MSSFFYIAFLIKFLFLNDSYNSIVRLDANGKIIFYQKPESSEKFKGTVSRDGFF